MATKKGLGKGLDSLISGSYAKKGTGQENLPEESKAAESPKSQSEEGTDALKEARLVKITEIERNKNQPRQNFTEESLEELAESIRQYGVLQPLLVKQEGTHYVIIAGERRWRAAKLAGLKEIPVLVKDYSNQEIMEISLIENIQRENLDVVEEAMAYRQLLEEYGYRQEDLAEKLSKSRAVITNRLRLLRLSETVLNYLREGKISEGHARTLLALENQEDQDYAASLIIERQLSVRETERLIKKMAEAEKAPEKVIETQSIQESIMYENLEEQLRDILGTKVQIQRRSRDKGKIMIEYYSLEELERLSDLMKKTR